jgi:hypothetical protein
MTSCNGNTNTKCGNTTKTRWRRLRSCLHQIAGLKETTLIYNIIKKYKKQPRKVLKHLKVLMKEKRKELGKKNYSHYLDLLKPLTGADVFLNNFEFGFSQT